MRDEDLIPAVLGRRAIVVGVQLGRQPTVELEDHLDELVELARSAGAEVVDRVVQMRPSPAPATLIGSGKAREIAAALSDLEADLVLFDDDLTPAQVKNLEKIFACPALDRSSLILEIFRQRARTREARTQVELAQLQYLLPRLTRRWGHLSRQVGGIGARGGEGEKQLEVDRRILRQRIAHLERDLVRIARTRNVQREGRRRVFEVALAGYTNAGKTTLFNRLTRARGRAEDRVFATLDSLLRRGEVGAGRTVVFADTVGFIRKLPHHLVASFRSTLEEVRWADLVLHVVDRSHPSWEEQQRVAEQVLAELGVDAERVLPVMNKWDQVAVPSTPRSGELWVSARTGAGIDELKAAIRRRLESAERSRRPPSPGGGDAEVAPPDRAPVPPVRSSRR